MAAPKDGGGDRGGSTPSLPEHKVIQQRLRSAIRQVWSRYSIERRSVLYTAKRTRKKTNKNGDTSKVPDVFYVCAECNGEFKATQIECDHIEPVGTTPAFPPVEEALNNWSAWLKRLFCGAENLRILCKPCHRLKSAKERSNGKVHKSRATKTKSKTGKRRGKPTTRKKKGKK